MLDNMFKKRMLIGGKKETGIVNVSFLTPDIIGSTKLIGITRSYGNSIYMSGGSYEYAVKINTLTDVWNDLSTNYGISKGKWTKSILAQNGKIYCPAYLQSSGSSLKIDPDTDTTSLVASIGSPTGGGHYGGSVLAENGMIYYIPRSNTRVLKVDPTDDSFSYIGSTYVGSEKWNIGRLAFNGKIYSDPYGRSTILKIDPDTDTTSEIPLPYGTARWRGGSLHSDGNIYYAPHQNTSNILRLDPSTDTVSLVTGFTVGAGQYVYFMLGIDNKMYGIPNGADDILVFNPISETQETSLDLGIGVSETKPRWSSCSMSEDGNIYAVTYNSNKIMKLDFSLISSQIGNDYKLPLDINDLPTSNFNKYYN